MNLNYYKIMQELILLPNNENYQKTVEVLLYLSTKTGPDIVMSVNYLSIKYTKTNKLGSC